jgi:integrase/recombinase XerC
VKSIVERFLLSLEANGRSPRTILSYEWRLTDFRRFMSARGITSVEALKPGDLDAWAVALRRQSERWADHPTRPVCNGGLSPASIAGRIQAVKTFLAWCARRGYLAQSPAAHLQKPRLDLDASDRVMDADDLRRLVAEAMKLARGGQRLALRDLALISFIAETGCRPGEALSLRVGWLDLANLEAMVKGKRGKRTVDYTLATADALRAWLAVHPGGRRVFVNRSGEPLTESGLYQVFKRLAKAASVAGRFNPQSVRHLVGQMFTDRANLELARDKLGHSSVTTTAQFYAHQDRERLRQATHRLSLIGPDADA